MDLVSTGARRRLAGRACWASAPTARRTWWPPPATASDGGVPIALPFVGVGEQGALWDNDVRGTLVGLDLSHGPGDVARAVLDGIILESHRCLARLHDLGLPAGEVRVAWRGADPWFCRRLADATGRPVLVGDPAETSSAAGAARLAAIAAGAELPPAGSGDDRYEPDPAQTARLGPAPARVRGRAAPAQAALRRLAAQVQGVVRALSSTGRSGPCTPGSCCRRPPRRAGR